MHHVSKAFKITVVLLSLLFFLSGCSSDNETHQNMEDATTMNASARQNENDDGPGSHASSLGNNISEANIEEPAENIAEEENEAAAQKQDTGNHVIELIPMEQLPELAMEPREPFTMEEAISFRTAILNPVYHDTFRYQIREFTRNPSRLVIDIGNTGGKTLVISDANLYFSIFDTEGNEIAGSKVQGAPVSIAPGEIKRVIVTAQNPDAGVVYIDIDGMNYPLVNPYYRALPNEEADIVNAKPYEHGYVIYDEKGIPYYTAEMSGEVVGNRKAKIMAEGVLPVLNDRIGPIDRGNGFLALVKVKIANTTGEEMKIDKILSDGAGESITFTMADLEVLGDKALPSAIKPHTIAEGWIPFRVGDGREGYGIVIYTSHGGFVLNFVNTYRII